MFINIKNMVGSNRPIVITDDKVNSIYGSLFDGIDVIVLPQGELNKNLDTIKYVYQRLIELEADKTCSLVGVGGGLVLDMTGFAASTFMRGLSFGFIPTTLIAMADAAYGGKNGVNFNGFKNIVGVFKEAEFIYSQPEFLRTLDEREFKAGIVEIIKTALVMDTDLFSFIEKEKDRIVNLDMEFIEHLIKKTLKIKMDLVKLDMLDNDERRKLNFGHTLGHALEYLSEGTLNHGEAVAEGIVFSAKASVALGYLKKEELERIEKLFWFYSINKNVNIKKYSKEDIIDAIKKDKKRNDSSVNFVFIQNIGKSFIQALPFGRLEELLHDLY